MTLKLIRNDITKMKTEAIVNAANEQLKAGSGVCGAIFNKAGYRQLTEACNAIGHCDTGDAVITPGFDLCRYIIHTVGPIWRGGKYREPEQLKSCYIRSLELARKYEIESISFPLISAGIYGYPRDEAIMIAFEAIQEFLQDNEMEVNLVFYDRKSFLSSNVRFDAVSRYITSNYYEPVQEERQLVHYNQAFDHAIPLGRKPAKQSRKLEDLIKYKGETFSEMLLRLIDEKGYTDVETYKRANIDRKLFSKIRNKEYQPSKPTALALCIALKLNRDEARDLLATAGYALSHSNVTDIIVEYFLSIENYNIFEVNETLFYFDQPVL